MASPLSLSCLLLLALALASRASAQLQCFDQPPPLDDTVHALRTADADEARTAALCHVACLNFVVGPPGGGGGGACDNGTCPDGSACIDGACPDTTASDVVNNGTIPTGGGNVTNMDGGGNGTNGTNMDGGGGGGTMPGVWELNCNALKKYLDCRTGCIQQSVGNCGACRQRCEDICQFSDCFGIDGNGCGVGCNRGNCDYGCEQHSSIAPVELMEPMEPPVLERIDSQELIYNLQISDELDMFLMVENPSVVFRIETEPGELVYHWMVDIATNFRDAMITDYLLDLNTYDDLSSVSVSFAIATQSGFSGYSGSTEVVLPGRCVVQTLASTQVSITDERDRRAGYFNHHVLNVSWCPTQCTEGVQHYEITKTGCGGTVSTTVNSTDSSVLIQDEDRDFIVLPCTADVEIRTVLRDGTPQTVTKSRRLVVDRFPKLMFSCPLKYDGTTGRYEVDFQFTAPLSDATLSNIEFFTIRYDGYVEGETVSFPVVNNPSFNIPAKVEKKVYGSRIQLEQFTEMGRFYRISASSFWEESHSGLPAIEENCELNADAPPPSPIENITVTVVDTQEVSGSEGSLDVTAIVRFEFEKPELQYQGREISYQAYFGDRPLNPTEDSNSVAGVEPLRGAVEGSFSGVSGSETTGYLQIRSWQFEDFPSKWSDPVTVMVIVLRRPDPVNNIDTFFEEVGIEYREGVPVLLLKGRVTWDESEPPGEGVSLEYRCEIGPEFIQEPKSPIANFDRLNISLSSGYSYNLEVTVIVRHSRLAERQESQAKTEIERFRPLPYPEDITVVAKEPLLVATETGTELRVNLTVEWKRPVFRGDFSNYEVKVRTESASRTFDEFRKRIGKNMISPDVTRFTDDNFTVSIVDPSNPQLLVQMRSLVDGETNLLPQWSKPFLVTMVILPPPVINSSQLISFTLTSAGGRLSITTALELSWEEPEGSAGLESYQVWVGSRALGQFEQVAEDEEFGKIIVFEVVESGDTTTENSTTAKNSTDSDNSTAVTGATLITERLSATFLSPSESGLVHVQIRSVSTMEIPKWSTPSIMYLVQSAPPPTEIKIVGDAEVEFDTDKLILDVKVELAWMLPPVLVGGGGEDKAPVVPAATSSPPLSSTETLLLPLPSPSPAPKPPRRRTRRQNGGGASQPGSGMGPGDNLDLDGSGSGMVDVDPVPFGDIVNIYAYIGKMKLDRFAPRPDDENVFKFEAGIMSGPLEASFSLADDKELLDLELFVQMQIETEGGFPVWSEAQQVRIPGITEPVSATTDPTVPAVASVVGAFVLALAAAIVIFLCCICYNRRKYKIDEGEDTLEIYSRPGLTGIYSGKGPILDEWEISTDDVIVDELLGEGAFGEVYKGVIRGPLENPKISAVLRQAIGVPVAIKLLKTTSAGKEKADFLAEIDMMKKIAEGYNSHIVNMVGCVTLQEPLCLITEFVPFGDLLSYLKYQRKKRSEARRRERLQQLHQEEEGEGEVEAWGERTAGDGYEIADAPRPAPYLEPPNAYSTLEPKTEGEPESPEDNSHYRELGDVEPDDLIRFAYQIASGMEYLASLKIVHRDLACRNVLIAKDKLLKITDFGLSREVQEVYVKKTRGRLPLKWMAIESITAREFTTASDVWAFGVALYEIGTIGGFPYPSINNEDLLPMLSQGYRLEKPDNCSAEVYDLMLRCWQEDPEDRPSFSNLRTSFSTMLQAGSPDTYIDLQVNEDAPYYQVKEEDRRDRSDSASSGSSVDSLDKKPTKKEKVKRKRTNPYVPTPDQAQGEGPPGEGEEGYIPMQSVGSALDRPAQLGIPISQLMPSASSNERQQQQLTPVDEAETPLDNRRTNPYVSEPSELADGSLVASSLPPLLETNGSVHDSSLGPAELTESTHL